jgi:hypothetical protein
MKRQLKSIAALASNCPTSRLRITSKWNEASRRSMLGNRLLFDRQ